MAHSSWGAGWPNCQTSRINRSFYVDTKWGRVTFPGGVRSELCELISRLVKECSNRGYRFGVAGNASYGCWGYSCRAIAGTSTPSNHSWGIAVDINAPRNPYTSPLKTDMPSWMPDLWNAYGFRWGGDYQGRKDAMHYEFMGSVQDAATKTALARSKNLGVGSTPPPAFPAFPFPAGHWMGIESKNPKNHSGYKVADRPGIQKYQQRLKDRGWIIVPDGRFGRQTRDVTVKYQTQKKLKVDGLAGEQTWRSVWTAPLTK